MSLKAKKHLLTILQLRYTYPFAAPESVDPMRLKGVPTGEYGYCRKLSCLKARLRQWR